MSEVEARRVAARVRARGVAARVRARGVAARVRARGVAARVRARGVAARVRAWRSAGVCCLPGSFAWVLDLFFCPGGDEKWDEARQWAEAVW